MAPERRARMAAERARAAVQVITRVEKNSRLFAVKGSMGTYTETGIAHDKNADSRDDGDEEEHEEYEEYEHDEHDEDDEDDDEDDEDEDHEDHEDAETADLEDSNDANSSQGKKGAKTIPTGTNIPRPSIHIDPFQSRAVSLSYLFTPEKWENMDLAPIDEAVARMHGECGNNEMLIREITKHLELYYEGVSETEEPVYSNNTRVQYVREQLEAPLRAHVNGEVLPYVPTRAEMLAARYCHPKGRASSRIATILVVLGLAHLAQV